MHQQAMSGEWQVKLPREVPLGTFDRLENGRERSARPGLRPPPPPLAQSRPGRVCRQAPPLPLVDRCGCSAAGAAETEARRGWDAAWRWAVQRGPGSACPAPCLPAWLPPPCRSSLLSSTRLAALLHPQHVVSIKDNASVDQTLRVSWQQRSRALPPCLDPALASRPAQPSPAQPGSKLSCAPRHAGAGCAPHPVRPRGGGQRRRRRQRRAGGRDGGRRQGS